MSRSSRPRSRTHAIDASERGRGPVREVGGRHTRRRDGAVRSSERAAHLLAALVSGGVREVVLAPGSRSAGLALALYAADAAGDVRLHVRVDERTAGFLALGLAAGSRTPVAVVTTSGTAVGNLLPAVMEASHSGRRLVVLAADRPAAMRGSGANQTTRQDGIFGVFAPCFDLGVDASSEELAAAAAVATRRRGPTHLNVQLEEPLLPESEPLVAPRHLLRHLLRRANLRTRTFRHISGLPQHERTGGR